MSRYYTPVLPELLATVEQLKTPLSLEEFLSEIMDTPPHQRTIEEMKQLIARLQLSDTFLKKFILFKPDRYYWKLLLQNEDLEGLVCCWMPGQKSGIHRHTGVSLNVTRVLIGTITEQLFKVDEQNHLVLCDEGQVAQGGLACTERYQYHQLVNNSTENCVTLHFYSPVRPE